MKNLQDGKTNLPEVSKKQKEHSANVNKQDFLSEPTPYRRKIIKIKIFLLRWCNTEREHKDLRQVVGRYGFDLLG